VRPSRASATRHDYNAVPAPERGEDIGFALGGTEKQSLTGEAYRAAMLHTVLYDTVITTWAAKYQLGH